MDCIEKFSEIFRKEIFELIDKPITVTIIISCQYWLLMLFAKLVNCSYSQKDGISVSEMVIND